MNEPATEYRRRPPRHQPPEAPPVDDVPGDDALKREPVVFDRSKEVLVARGGSGGGVICCTGGLHQLGLHLRVFDRYLAEHDLTAIYVRDFTHRFHIHGVGELGATHERTVAALRMLLDILSVRVLHTVGSSAGGFAALAYGLELGARKMLSFSGATSYSRQHCSAEMLEIDKRIPRMADHFNSLPDLARLDMRARLTTKRMKGEMHIFYGKHMPQDRAHARHLAGLAGVHLHPVGHYQGHNTIARLAATGKLRKTLGKILAPV